MTFEIIHGRGVTTHWIVTLVDRDGSETRLSKSLIEVEELIADSIRPQAMRIAKTVYGPGNREFHLDDGSVVEFRWEPYVFDWRCLDCGVDTDAIDEYYMVHDSLWRQVVPVYDGHLCIGCLEARIGRRLTAADFTDANVNSSVTLARSARLRDRLGRR